MKKLFTLFLSVGFLIGVNAQAPVIEWQKSLGGTSTDIAVSVIQTYEGGYVVAGYTTSNDGDVIGSHAPGNYDYWVVKLNSGGVTEWKKCFGGNGDDKAYAVIQTTDSGYVIVGVSNSTDGDVIGNHGSADLWIVKVNNTGTIQWQKCLGGSSWENNPYGYFSQTTDGGFVLSCFSNSNDGDIQLGHGVQDYCIFKLDSVGTIQWQKSLGGSANEQPYSTIQTADGGYAIVGSSESNDGDVSGNHGSFDYWIVKLSSAGILEWQKSLGGSAQDLAYSIVQTNDGGYVIAGNSKSTNGNVTGIHIPVYPYYYSDYWIVKTDSVGVLEWQKCLGGNGPDHAHSIVQTLDGGYAIAGRSGSTNGDITAYHGTGNTMEYWVVKLNSTASLVWQKSLGGTKTDYAYSIIQTTDGGYAIAGESSSDDGDVTGHHGPTYPSYFPDFWIVKLSPDTGTFDSVSSIENPQSEIRIYPNPATNQLFIETNGMEVEQINIYNTTGSLVSQTKEPQSKSIDISTLPNGIYIAEIKSKEASVRKRWVKI